MDVYLRFQTACRTGDVETVKNLINDGHICKDIDNGFCPDNLTALICACFWGNVEIVRVLLETGKANPEYRSPRCEITWIGDTALSLACQWGRVEIVKLLLADGHSNLGNQNEFGWTALMHACHYYTNMMYICHYYNNIELVTVLLNSGQARPELKNNEGYDALTLARKNGSTDIDKLLTLYMDMNVVANVKHAAKKI